MATQAGQKSRSNGSSASAMQKIVPHLWFDDQAEEASEFYASLLPNSSVGRTTRYSSEGSEIHGQPEGRVMTVDFEVAGYRFVALNGGPHFRFTPAVSFFITCESISEIDELWRRLSDGGTTLMELDRYDWSERYGWLADRFGLSWQVFLGDAPNLGPKIVPCLMYVGQRPAAQEAMDFYTSIFADSGIDQVTHHDEQGQMAGMTAHARFRLDGEVFIAMDGGPAHAFGFSEATSFMIPCKSQEEIDYFWEKLGEGGDPKARQCGWLKDRFGVSWQVTPTALQEMLLDADDERVKRVTRAFLSMKKLEISELQRAYQG